MAHLWVPPRFPVWPCHPGGSGPPEARRSPHRYRTNAFRNAAVAPLN
ncbi:hypothetical protein SGM_0317 [Streptomyces griseoaurantiacus M045]|uniref:Uncharacterized protein n=1 Tax=Streptomyces griseoaurantiacus M045 TaxID=996637 RepID=F3NAD3_9ACTN|nr:hypothetical protein SGM_0317 [Streptomyces griseoaurantiacus M045]